MITFVSIEVVKIRLIRKAFKNNLFRYRTVPNRCPPSPRPIRKRTLRIFFAGPFLPAIGEKSKIQLKFGLLKIQLKFGLLDRKKHLKVTN